MNIICNYELTEHASCRAQQRGVTHETLAFVIGYADIWLHAGEGCLAARVSHKQLEKLSQEGVSSSLLERAANVVAVIDPAAGIIVTVLHDFGSKDGRRYRTQWPTKSHKWRCNHRRNGMKPRSKHFQNMIRPEDEAIH